MSIKRNHPETHLQANVTFFLRLALPKDAWFTSIPGGNRGVTTTPGYTPGTPDMLILRGENGQVFPYWIELKAQRGVLSNAQRVVQGVLLDLGCCVATCKSVEQVERALLGWGFTLRATVGRRAA